MSEQDAAPGDAMCTICRHVWRMSDDAGTALHYASAFLVAAHFVERHHEVTTGKVSDHVVLVPNEAAGREAVQE